MYRWCMPNVGRSFGVTGPASRPRRVLPTSVCPFGDGDGVLGTHRLGYCNNHRSESRNQSPVTAHVWHSLESGISTQSPKEGCVSPIRSKDLSGTLKILNQFHEPG